MFIYYFYYKIKLINDKEYDKLCEINNVPKSVFWSEVFPFQVCNISYLVVPLGILFDIRACIGFGLLVAPFAFFFAILMPYPGFSDDSLLKPRISGFYFTHLFMLFMSLVTWMTKEFVLNYQLAFEVSVLIFICSAIAHLANRILYNTGLCKDANYFFTMDASFNPLMQLFYNLIPIKWVYQFPIQIFFWLVFNLIVFIYNLIK